MLPKTDKLLKVLETFYSDKHWHFDGECLYWLDESPMPSSEHIEILYNNIIKNQYKTERKNTILQEFSIEDQLEAITEFLMNKPEKLNKLLEFIKKTKETIKKN